ncbi:MAG: DUF262 domain-containing protein [Acidimicrobiales bacterium]|nr:DUF262 domain-containing protein [Acidimicrobiales bacterium]
MFQPAVPVAKVLQGVHNSEYVLPAIQREFVWNTDQITTLFDSLMRGYPIGAFLFWKVEPEQAAEFTFYDFITNYHEKSHPYAPTKQIPSGQGATAILDGQQRLTALNIGLYGSHAERQPRKWWTNPDAFPKKRLYLNLLGVQDADEPGMVYDFKFLTDAEAQVSDEEPERWFLVNGVLKLADSGPAIMADLESRQLSGSQPFNALYQLFRAVRETNSVNAFLEESQDPNKVLDIFVRVNSGGTPLSYSDLLLSMATNQWKDRDAREEVRTLVSDLNDRPAAFTFSKDLILKSGLVLIDVPDIGFKVSNFTRSNMSLMEEHWAAIRSSLLTAADLMASFGYSGRTVTADSVVVPIAYYLHRRGGTTSYVEASAFAADRLQVRQWVARSLMKRGIWGSGLDTLLSRLREAIRTHGASGFPASEIEGAMTAAGKSLKFEEAEISELLDLRYGSQRVFPVLATLYPGLDLTKAFHEDHIFPRSRFTRTKLLKAGVPAEELDEFISKVDGLPNLQLLQGSPNIEKQAMLPSEWLEGPHFPSPAGRTQYENDNDLVDVPKDITGFLQFYEGRRQKLDARLREALGVV